MARDRLLHSTPRKLSWILEEKAQRNSAKNDRQNILETIEAPQNDRKHKIAAVNFSEEKE